MRNTIAVHGARENNLKNVDVEIPRDALCVFTGLSGSGKSSLAFDTIYAEGRRRYVEPLSAYGHVGARHDRGHYGRPDPRRTDHAASVRGGRVPRGDGR